MTNEELISHIHSSVEKYIWEAEGRRLRLGPNDDMYDLGRVAACNDFMVFLGLLQKRITKQKEK